VTKAVIEGAPVSTHAKVSAPTVEQGVISRTITMTALLGAAAGVVLMAANVAQDIYVHSAHRMLQDRVWILDVDQEGSIYTWVSLAMLFGNAIAMAFVANLRAGAGRPDSLQWSLLALGFAALSMDESVGLHEKLGEPVTRLLHLTGWWTYGWVIAAVPAVLMALILFVPLLRRIPPAIAWRLLAAGALFVTGAVGMEMLSGAIGGPADQRNLLYRALAACEETLELAGAILCLYVVGRNISILSDY
jgi:hypothetical protein